MAKATKKPKTKKVPPLKDSSLNIRQETFCQLYAGFGEKSCLNNGTLSYIQAYSIETATSRMLRKWKGKKYPAYWDYEMGYKSARVSAHDLLTKPNIRARIYQLFKLLFSADVVDSELLSVILQDGDAQAKVAAIREFNNLKGRITKKLKLSGAIKSNLSPDRLREIAKFISKEKVK